MRTLFVLPGALVGLLTLGSCQRDNQKPGYDIEMLADMKHPIPYEAYSSNPKLPGNVTLQQPVPGTVARGAMISLPQSNPVPFSPAALSRGEHIFNNYCAICHGPAGEGDGPLIPKYPNPPSYRQQRVMDMTAPQLFLSITNGKKDMPSHAAQVTEEDRWKVIYYIEKLQGKRL